MKVVTLDKYLINNYVKCAWAVLVSGRDAHRGFENFSRRYRAFLVSLVNHSQLSSINLIISLYYLDKYAKNSVNALDKSDFTMIKSLIVISLVISNKCYDDQCYTLKTWLNIIEQQHCKYVQFTLPLLNGLEQHFLNVINYKSSFAGVGCDIEFWSVLTQRALALKVPLSVIDCFKAQVCESPSAIATPCGVASQDVIARSRCATPTPSNRSSPVMSIANSSSVLVGNYSPLTPLTPCVLIHDPASLKKRKLNSRVDGVPKTFAIPTDSYFANPLSATTAHLQVNSFNNYCI